tara:strand:- start:353 stop:880 length:528 start_codon:yes stop_codon:yes gene_type:complete
MLPTLIKTSFFEDPQEIINYSKKIKWIKSTNNDNWPGYRSDNLFYINKKLHDCIIDEIVKLYFRGKQVQIGSTKIQFHKISYEDWLSHNRKNTRIHKDFTDLAGIIYLNKNTNNLKTGTSIYDEEKQTICQISNNFNTLACYDGNHYHGATGLDKNERLTIVIFLNEIRIFGKWP